MTKTESERERRLFALCGVSRRTRVSRTAAEGTGVGRGLVIWGVLNLAAKQQRCVDSHASSTRLETRTAGQVSEAPPAELPVRLQRTGTKGRSGGGVVGEGVA